VKVNQGIENSLSGQYESRKKGILEKKRKEKGNQKEKASVSLIIDHGNIWHRSDDTEQFIAFALSWAEEISPACPLETYLPTSWEAC
jgi:hypothetical protein